MEETLRSNLLLLAAKFSTATQTSRPTIALRALNDNTFFTRVSAGSGFTLSTYDRLVTWFSENWPDGIEWPTQIVRQARGVGAE